MRGRFSAEIFSHLNIFLITARLSSGRALQSRNFGDSGSAVRARLMRRLGAADTTVKT